MYKKPNTKENMKSKTQCLKYRLTVDRSRFKNTAKNQ